MVEPEPVLLGASLIRGQLDEYSGLMIYGPFGPSGTAPAVLELRVVDEDDDLLGIRIREEYVLPNGLQSSFEETYPALVDERWHPHSATISVPVHFRSGNRVKDEDQWQAYVDQVSGGA